MKNKLIPKVIGLLARALISTCGLGAVMLVIGWIVGWNSSTLFSNGLFISGAALIAVGILTVLGGTPIRDDYQIFWAESIGDYGLFDRSQRWLANMMHGYSGFGLLILTGIFLVGLAILLPSLF